MCGLFPGFRHGAGDVEDACWQLLGELQLLVPSHEEHMYLGRLMEPVADRVPFYTPGPPFKVCACLCVSAAGVCASRIGLMSSA